MLNRFAGFNAQELSIFHRILGALDTAYSFVGLDEDYTTDGDIADVVNVLFAEVSGAVELLAREIVGGGGE